MIAVAFSFCNAQVVATKIRIERERDDLAPMQDRHQEEFDTEQKPEELGVRAFLKRAFEKIKENKIKTAIFTIIAAATMVGALDAAKRGKKSFVGKMLGGGAPGMYDFIANKNERLDAAKKWKSWFPTGMHDMPVGVIPYAQHPTEKRTLLLFDCSIHTITGERQLKSLRFSAKNKLSKLTMTGIYMGKASTMIEKLALDAFHKGLFFLYYDPAIQVKKQLTYGNEDDKSFAHRRVFFVQVPFVSEENIVWNREFIKSKTIKNYVIEETFDREKSHWVWLSEDKLTHLLLSGNSIRKKNFWLQRDNKKVVYKVADRTSDLLTDSNTLKLLQKIFIKQENKNSVQRLKNSKSEG